VKAAARQGVAGARGAFSDTLEALTQLLHARTQQLVLAGRDIEARRTATVMPLVEAAKTKAQNNVSPNLLTAALLRDMHRVMAP
jgi:DNA polymerase-3 subunit delta'